ncbi:hypothetical protein Csa_003547 [Cucumis sativus]|uniref:Uncharacterized protein n=1 Tax=Cucumis sativus TaxID=3659 RepID=A0A0A0KHF2_CUCSA|nr:hypothetical protein Csa_003547 [Cucumis sativus]
MIKEEEEQQKGSVKKVKRSLEERREGDGGRHKRKRGSEMGSGRWERSGKEESDAALVGCEVGTRGYINCHVGMMSFRKRYV